MEKLDEDSAAKFINALIKSLQTLCHGYLNFDNGIEIVGHINLNVDKGSSMHYILEEKVCKNEENSTLFISNSFHAQNQNSKSKGKDSDTVGNRNEEKTSSADLGQAGKLSAISSISSALSKSHEKNRSGSTSSAKDSENLHSKPLSSTAKRKASDDYTNDVRAAKQAQLCSSPSPVSHFLSQSPHDPSGSSSPVDTKPSLRQLHGDESSGTVLPQTAAVSSDNAGDLGVNLVGSVLERVDDQSNSDLQDRGDDSDGDLEVTFIKEEYVEGEQSACQFENSGGQQYGRGTLQRASSSDMSDGSMYPVSLHHSQSASSTFVPSSHDLATAQHYGPSTSSQPQPGTSGIRGSRPVRPSTLPQHSPSPRVRSQIEARPMPHMPVLWGTLGDWGQASLSQHTQHGGAQGVGSAPLGAASDVGRSGTAAPPLYKCQWCDAEFMTSHGYKGHVRKNHSNDPNFRCKVCGKGFMMRGHYVGHMNMHNNVKTFQCPSPLCGRRFAYKSSLNAHLKCCSTLRQQEPQQSDTRDGGGDA
ncbi:uncharacterized protein LOC143299566 isoform X7 [Babylonia areolata]|uniref:uncharacterized protein LOC143299566 isoform X7 n=1 Tax=Babylonia areolata TaxID=304850 RepID=UPI003FD42482